MKHYGIAKYACLLAASIMLMHPSAAMAAPTKLPAGRVTFIEVTYLPGVINFKLSKGDGVCPAGAFLTWQNSNVDNVKSVLSVVLAAKLSGQPLYAWYDPATVHKGMFGTNGCLISFIGIE